MRDNAAADKLARYSARARREQVAAGLMPGAPLPRRDPKHDDVVKETILALIAYGCEAHPIYVGPTVHKGIGGKPGVLDIGGWKPAKPWAKPLAVEIKMRGDTLSPEQIAYIAAVKGAGGIALVVCDSVADLARQWKE